MSSNFNKTQFISPKSILPQLHQKTHFKGATNLFINTPGIVVNLEKSDPQFDNVL